MHAKQVLIKESDLTAGDVVGYINAREKSGMSKEEIRQLAESIEDSGLLNDLVVGEVDHEGKKARVLVGGARRMMAITLLLTEGKGKAFKDGIPAKVHPCETVTDLKLLALLDNIQRADLSSFELAQEMMTLAEEPHSMKQTDMAARLSKSQTWVSRTLGAFKASSGALKKAWKSGKIPDDTVYDIAKLEAEKQDEAVENQLKLRESGDRAGKKKARKAAKGSAAAGGDRPSLSTVRDFFGIAEEANYKDNAYASGVKDGLRFVLGEIGVADFHRDWDRFLNERAKRQKEEDAKAKKTAMEFAASKGKNGKGKETTASA